MTFRRFLLAASLLPPALQAQTNTPCTGLCKQQVQCPNGGTTTITGTVYAPNGTDPVPNVTVYIPNSTVDPLPAGISCPVPGALPSGSPLLGTFSNFDGSFTLTNVPVGSNIPLVIVAGKWRSQFTVNVANTCANNVASNIRFARNQTEGDIPKFAVVTGNADQVECVLRKVGLDDAEFTPVGGTGRIQIAPATGNGGAVSGSSTLTQDAVLGDSAALKGFDVLMLPCEGAPYLEPSAQLANLISYANGGGRIYASHYAYEWTYKNPPFDTVATWRGTSLGRSDGPATVNQNFGSGATLAKWLQYVGASTTLGQINVQTTRSDVSALAPATQNWLTLNSTSDPMQFTWDAPVGATNQQCGRVLFNEYHVENLGSSKGKVFPAECSNAGAMTPQEKLLEYSLFDLSNNGGPATILPSSYDFGPYAVGYTTPSQTFTITNNSVFTAGIGSASATGDFLVTGDTCASVKAGSTCTVGVAFKPTALGQRTGSLAVTFAGTSLTASLTGTGVTPFTTNTTSLTFGSYDVGASSPAQAITITNQAPAALSLPNFAVTGDYSASTNCPASIPVGASCQLSVVFKPTTTGTRAGTISATGMNGNIVMTGTGVDFAMQFASPTADVYAGLKNTATLTTSPLAGFNAPVTLTCTTTAPAATCALDKSSFTLSESTTSTLTLTTVSKYTLAGYGSTSMWNALAGVLSTWGVFFLRRRHPTLFRAGLVCTMLWIGSTALTGCSGKIPTQNAAYTPAGTYDVTVTGADGFLTHSATYRLTVKDK